MKIGEVRELQTSLVRILHVDDSAEWLVFIQTQLHQNPNLCIVGVASNGMEAVKKADQLQPDLILLDVGLPILDGIQAALRIQKIAPQSVILFLSQNSEPDVVRVALSVGGRGFVLKSETIRDLEPGIEAVLRGKRFVSRGLLNHDE